MPNRSKYLALVAVFFLVQSIIGCCSIIIPPNTPTPARPQPARDEAEEPVEPEEPTEPEESNEPNESDEPPLNDEPLDPGLQSAFLTSLWAGSGGAEDGPLCSRALGYSDGIPSDSGHSRQAGKHDFGYICLFDFPLDEMISIDLYDPAGMHVSRATLNTEPDQYSFEGPGTEIERIVVAELQSGSRKPVGIAGTGNHPAVEHEVSWIELYVWLPPGRPAGEWRAEANAPTHNNAFTMQVEPYSCAGHEANPFAGSADPFDYDQDTADPCHGVTSQGRPSKASSQTLHVLFGGDARIREAVLSAGNWSYLAGGDNAELVFEDLEGGTVDTEMHMQDIEYCRQLLAEAGYGDGYTILLLISSPSTTMSSQAAERLSAYLSDCGITADVLVSVSYSEAYQMIELRAAAGESGLLISAQ